MYGSVSIFVNTKKRGEEHIKFIHTILKHHLYIHTHIYTHTYTHHIHGGIAILPCEGAFAAAIHIGFSERPFGCLGVVIVDLVFKGGGEEGGEEEEEEEGVCVCVCVCGAHGGRRSR